MYVKYESLQSKIKDKIGILADRLKNLNLRAPTSRLSNSSKDKTYTAVYNYYNISTTSLYLFTN